MDITTKRGVRQYCPSAEFVMKAFLPNYEIQFKFWSKKRNGGISSIIEMLGELVHGVIYEVLVNEMLELDILESVPQDFYKREAFPKNLRIFFSKPINSSYVTLL